MTASTAVQMTHVTKRFGASLGLDDVSLNFREGTSTALIGPSGSGKTTVIRCINHLLPIDAGRILVFGDLLGYQAAGPDRLIELPEARFCRQRADIGMVFQHFNLFHNMTVLGNVTEALVTVKRMRRAEAREKAVAALETVGMAGRQQAYASELSGGQQQRVAIARALAMDPRLMLFDEPTSMLDPELVGEVLEVMKALARSGRTIIFVTHELDFARDACDNVVFMERGRVVEAGTPEQVLSASANPRIREFMKRVA